MLPKCADCPRCARLIWRDGKTPQCARCWLKREIAQALTAVQA